MGNKLATNYTNMNIPTDTTDIQKKEKKFEDSKTFIPDCVDNCEKKINEILPNIRYEYNNILKKIMKQNQEISEIVKEIKKISNKNIYIILFLWLSWIIDFSIFVNEDFRVLFFSNLNNITIIFMMVFYFFVALIETMNIMKPKKTKKPLILMF